MDNETKTCNKCKQTKELDQFHRNKYGKQGRHNYCRVCFKSYNDNSSAIQRKKASDFLSNIAGTRSSADKAVIWASSNAEVREKFITKISVADSGCFEWTGRLNASGYGMFDVAFTGGGDRQVLAHRLAFAIRNGHIPDSTKLQSDTLVINHICHNRKCVNPDHLEVITHAHNLSTEKRAK